MNVALILVSLGIANAPLPFGHPLVVAYFEDMASCVEAANQAKLPVAGIPGRFSQHLGAVCVRASETHHSVGIPTFANSRPRNRVHPFRWSTLAFKVLCAPPRWRSREAYASML